MTSSLRLAIRCSVFLAMAPAFSCAGAGANGCGKAGLASGTYTMADPGGVDPKVVVTRTFRVHVPTGYNQNVPAPLVVIFHGWGGNESEFIGNRTVVSEANRRGYILVAPRGLGSSGGDNSNNSWSFSGSTTGLDDDGVNSNVPGDTTAICDAGITPNYSYRSCAVVAQNTCSWTHCQANDAEFAVALVDHVKGALCVDSDNVFATGGSNGGMFTWELGQNPVSAGTFRAIASLIGLPHRAYLDGKGKSGDMPALVITGTRDDVVPPGAWDNPSFTTTSNGSDRFYYTGATAITRSWAMGHGGCVVSGPATAFNDSYTAP